MTKKKKMTQTVTDPWLGGFCPESHPKIESRFRLEAPSSDRNERRWAWCHQNTLNLYCKLQSFLSMMIQPWTADIHSSLLSKHSAAYSIEEHTQSLPKCLELLTKLVYSSFSRCLPPWSRIESRRLLPSQHYDNALHLALNDSHGSSLRQRRKTRKKKSLARFFVAPCWWAAVSSSEVPKRRQPPCFLGIKNPHFTLWILETEFPTLFSESKWTHQCPHWVPNMLSWKFSQSRIQFLEHYKAILKPCLVCDCLMEVRKSNCHKKWLVVIFYTRNPTQV